MGADLSWAAMYSLKSVDNWIATINSNMNGSSRTAYKSSKVKLGTSNQTVLRAPTGSIPGLQIPDPALVTEGTSIDFSQGAIVASTEDTHFGIQGKGFFLLGNLTAADFANADPTGIFGIWGLPATPSGRAFLTRDGEFHWGIHPDDPSGRPILMNKDGLVVMVDHGDFNQAMGFMTKILFDRPYDSSPPFDKGRPSVVSTTEPLNNLKFSKYGSTVFEAPSAVTNIIDGSHNQISNGTTSLVESSLEASNASVTQLVPELSTAQKMYTAISKIFQIINQNTDIAINLIK